MEHIINSAIRNRRSAMAFSPEVLPQEQIMLLFEAARWAPSAYNDQPWQFFYAHRYNPDKFELLLGMLAPGNAEWAKHASLLVISVAKLNLNLNLNGKPNFHALHDTGMATANMLIQAELMGLVSHVMGGIDRGKIRESLNLSPDFEVVAAIAFGKPGNPEVLSEPNRKRASTERTRRHVGDIAIEL